MLVVPKIHPHRPPPPRGFDTQSQVVRHHKEGDVAAEHALEMRMRDLGLLDNKRMMEERLSQRLEECMKRRDLISNVISRCRRRRPLKAGVLSAAAEIRGVITPTIIRNDDGSKKEYAVKILMGYFTHDVRYTVDDYVITIRGACPAGEEGKLTKEIRLEFPTSVAMEMLEASYAAGVFRVVVPFVDATTNCYHGNPRAALPSIDTDQETHSVTSSDDTHDCQSSLSDEATTWL